MNYFDAHLDLAYLVEKGRDMHAAPKDAKGTLLPASVTLPSLIEGGVSHALATVFTESAEGAELDGPFAYPAGDWEAARRSGLRQLMLYESWRQAGAVRLFDESHDAPLSIGVLVECADPIESPEALQEWYDRGVRAVGLTWANRGRYADGNGVHPKECRGLTDEGLEMVRAIDAAGAVHDASHLCQRGVEALFDATDALVIASHSNCRRLFDADGSLTKSNQRHLADGTIAEIGKRGGVVGLNLLSDFLSPQIKRGQRASLDDCIAHVEHVCEVMGHKNGVGIGTDMDGGFGADRLPKGVDGPSDLSKLTEALRSRGWTQSELEGFAFGNFARVFGVQSSAQ